MIQRETGTFRWVGYPGRPTVLAGGPGGGAAMNCADLAGGAVVLGFGATPSQSAGDTIIDAVSINPPSTANWSLVGFSVSAGLCVITQLPGLNSGQAFGRFGRIYCAIIPRNAAPSGINQATPDNTAMLPLPQDMSLGGVLWDPGTDPLPPMGNQYTSAVEALLPVEMGLQLPEPIVLQEGAQVGIGIWMAPSVRSNSGLYVFNAEYTVLYDDGLPIPAPL